MTYQIKRWDECFEGAKSKTYNNKSACTMPTKHGLGYKRLVKQKEGAALFGAWCALVQVLSRHPKVRQGYLTNNGKPEGNPYTADDLECLTDIPSKHFAALFEVCLTESVDWLHVTDARIPQGTTRIPQETDKEPQSQLDSNSDLDSNPNPDADVDSNPMDTPPHPAMDLPQIVLEIMAARSDWHLRAEDVLTEWKGADKKVRDKNAQEFIRDVANQLSVPTNPIKMLRGYLSARKRGTAGKSGTDSVWAMTEKLKRLQDKRDLKWTDDEWRKGDECKRMNVEIRRLKKELEA